MLNIEDVIADRKRREERAIQYEKDNPHIRLQNKELADFTRAQLLRGEIIDPSLQKWMESEISAARTAFIIGIILTVLIKWQIVIWIIMYIAYRLRVKSIKKKAWNRNIKDYGRYLK